MMKFFKWRIFIITAIACLLPILLGLVLWKELPERMAIHLDFYGNPDGFASKPFAVFGLPLLMVVLQAFCCFINDVNAHHKGERVKFSLVTKWIIPIMSAILYVVTLGIALGWDIDVRKAVGFIVGAMFLVIGNYMPKFDYIKNYDLDTEKARKINRFIGYETVIMGLLFIISIFLPPIVTALCIFLLIPYAVIGVIYGIKTAKK